MKASTERTTAMKLELDTDNDIQMRMLAGYLLGNLKTARVISLLSTEDRITPFASALQGALNEMGGMNITYVPLTCVSFSEALRQNAEVVKKSIKRAFSPKLIRPAHTADANPTGSSRD